MAKFVLADHVARLEYDFTAFGGKRGTIPEPSSSMVNAFQASATERLVNTGVATREELCDDDGQYDAGKAAEAFDRLSAAQRDQVVGDLYESIQAVCSGEITVDDLEQIGYRGAQSFLGWLMGELMDPESSSAATPRSLRAVSNG